MPDLDALRARGWQIEIHAKGYYPRIVFFDARRERRGIINFEPDDRATAEAMLLAACDRADAGRNPEEGRCDRCGRPYPVWYAPNEVWNGVVRLPDGSDQYPFLCPSCFVELGAVFEFDEAIWRVAPDGLPTERERALEEALRFYADPFNYNDGVPGHATSIIDGDAMDWEPDGGARARRALNPRKEAPDG